MEQPVELFRGMAPKKAGQAVIVGHAARDIAGLREFAAYVVFGDSIGGTVALETAHDPEYRGEWVREATVDWSHPHRVHRVTLSGVYLAFRFVTVKPSTGDIQLLLMGN